jgi:hypothetical protein
VNITPNPARLLLYFNAIDDALHDNGSGDRGTPSPDPDARSAALRYWEVNAAGQFVHKVADLAAEHGLHGPAFRDAVNRACTAYVESRPCSTCGAHRPIRSRDEYLSHSGQRFTYAWTCDHCQEGARRAAEVRRLAEQQAAEETQRQCQARLQTYLARRREDFGECAPWELSFTTAVSAAALLRAGGSQDLAYIASHKDFALNLTPSVDFDRQVLTDLYRSGLISIHPGSKPGSVILNPDDDSFRYFPLEVHWLLSLPLGWVSTAKYLESLEDMISAPHEDWPQHWHAQAAELHRIVAFEECMQYLRVCMEDHGFEIEASDKLTHAVRSILANFSIARAFNFIWRAARNAAAFSQRAECYSRTHAVNTIPGSLQRSAERAIAEQWDVNPYRRDRRSPESALSHVLFTVALKLPDGGLGTVPPAPADVEGRAADR